MILHQSLLVASKRISILGNCSDCSDFPFRNEISNEVSIKAGESKLINIFKGQQVTGDNQNLKSA